MDPLTLLTIATAFVASSVAQKCADATIDAVWAKLRERLEPFLAGKEKAAALEELPAQLAADSEVRTLVETALGHTSALRRVLRMADIVSGTRILWIDDQPQNNIWERALFRQLGAEIRSVETTDTAEALLGRESFDIVISDISRNGDPEAGLKALPEINARCEAPVILYIGKVAPEKGVPVGAFGITNRPDELLHLVLDVVERNRI